MAHADLLNNCRSYFERAQTSWDTYFLKWEAMAKDETIDEEITEDPIPERRPIEKKQKKFSTSRKLLDRSIFILNRRKNERFNSAIENKTKRKKGKNGRKICDPKPETKIIHKTENQTNLECEVVNNKHFEADLKAIFIEILSENTNKTEMFSVLSRMYSSGGKMLRNFSINSTIMEKKENSMLPVRKTLLHSVPHYEFLHRDLSPCRQVNNESERTCMNVTFRDSVHTSNFHALNETIFSLNRNWNESHLEPFQPFLKDNWSGNINTNAINQRFSNRDRLSNKITNYLPDDDACANYQRLLDTGKTGIMSDNGFPPQNITQFINSPFRSLHLGIVGPSQPLEETVNRSICNKYSKCISEPRNRKRKKVNPVFDSSDDDSEDDVKDKKEDSPTRFLKIFCTPKRPRRSLIQEKMNHDSDDDCFSIFDRVKRG